MAHDEYMDATQKRCLEGSMSYDFDRTTLQARGLESIYTAVPIMSHEGQD